MNEKKLSITEYGKKGSWEIEYNGIDYSGTYIYDLLTGSIFIEWDFDPSDDWEYIEDLISSYII